MAARRSVDLVPNTVNTAKQLVAKHLVYVRRLIFWRYERTLAAHL